MQKVVGVRFKGGSKIYTFGVGKSQDNFNVGDGVIVETAKGPELAEIASGVKSVDESTLSQELKNVVRRANDHDYERLKEFSEKAPETVRTAQRLADEAGLDMSFSAAEYSFDGKKIVLYFTSENRIDFRDLVRNLASELKARIELRQIGIRDETKLLGGLGPCGRDCCCSACLPDFRKVSIKMAKTQGLSLNPVKISGLCGRLMCCLEYENDYYAEVYKKMPKLGGTVGTPDGDGVVVSNDMLKLRVKVRIKKQDGTESYEDFDVKDVRFRPRGNDEKPNASANNSEEKEEI